VARERGPERVPRGGRRGLVCCRRRHCREPEEEGEKKRVWFGGFAISAAISPLWRRCCAAGSL
jgi:ribosomal protein S6E (S10)